MNCSYCGVELEADMTVCPLCGKPVNDGQADREEDAPYNESGITLKPPLNKRQRRFTWEIISIILGSGIVAAFAVNFIISGTITWSEYTTAAGLVIFCYVSIFAFLRRNSLVETAAAFILSSICLLAVDYISGGAHWSARLAIPLLLCVNTVVLTYAAVVRSSRFRGLNLIAYGFLAAALICLCAEGIISFYINGLWLLRWSIIVAACAAPVIIVLLFLHFRLRKKQILGRTFHI